MADGFGTISEFADRIRALGASGGSATGGSEISDLFAQYLALQGGGGGGGGGADHFFDLSPMDEFNIFHTNRVFEAQQQQNQLDAALDQAALNHRVSMDQANLALAQGELGLARQKAADANHWQQVSAGLEQQRVALQAQSIASQQAIAQMNAQVDMRGQDLNFALGTRGQDVSAAGNVDQARLGVLRDETDRLLGQQSNQISQFGQETQRAVGMGNLAQQVNQFLLDNASQPDNLFSTFLLQRGITPDFPTIRAGGTPAQGNPIVPTNPLTAFVPTTAAPDFNIPANSALAAGVGAASEGVLSSSPQVPASNIDFSGIMGFPNLPGSGSAGGGGGIPLPPSAGAGGGGVVSSTPVPPEHSPQIAGTAGSVLPPGPAGQTIAATGTNASFPDSFSGIRITDIHPGFNLLTTGTAGPTTVGDFDPRLQLFLGTGPNATRLTDKAQVIPGGTPLGIIAPRDFTAAAGGGAVNSSVIRVGERPDGKPNRTEEVVVNPTNAPLFVMPNPHTVANMPRFALGAPPPPPDQLGQLGLSASDIQGFSPSQIEQILLPHQQMRMGQTPQGVQDLLRDPSADVRFNTATQFGIDPRAALTRFELAQRNAPDQGSELVRRFRREGGRPQAPATSTAASPTSTSNPGGPNVVDAVLDPTTMVDAGETMPGPIIEEDFGIPTGQTTAGGLQLDPGPVDPDAALRAQYEAAGLGHLLLPSSQNLQVLQDQRTAPLLRQLAGFGIPISPALQALTGGFTPGNLNVQGAAATRGLGIAPSLQQINRLAPGEFRHFRDLIQGPGGISFDDYIASIRQPTSNLRAAASARFV